MILFLMMMVMTMFIILMMAITLWRIKICITLMILMMTMLRMLTNDMAGNDCSDLGKPHPKKNRVNLGTPQKGGGVETPAQIVCGSSSVNINH